MQVAVDDALPLTTNEPQRNLIDGQWCVMTTARVGSALARNCVSASLVSVWSID
jgi:hypothetical protein